MTNPLLLHSNKEIPFRTGFCSIYNPSIEEIGMIGEENFHIGIRFLNFSKDTLDDKDKNDLLDKSDFDILIAMMNLKEEYSDYITKSIMVLSLLFPSFDISIEKDKILLAKRDSNFKTFISARNYDEFKEIIDTIFVLSSKDPDSGNYNPADGMAARIAKKLEERRMKLNKQKGIDTSLEKQTLYGKIASILSIGLKMDINIFMKYTVYQLMMTYKRYQLNEAYEMNIKARLAGATDLEDPPDWQDNILL